METAFSHAFDDSGARFDATKYKIPYAPKVNLSNYVVSLKYIVKTKYKKSISLLNIKKIVLKLITYLHFNFRINSIKQFNI